MQVTVVIDDKTINSKEKILLQNVEYRPNEIMLNVGDNTYIVDGYELIAAAKRCILSELG